MRPDLAQVHRWRAEMRTRADEVRRSQTLTESQLAAALMLQRAEAIAAYALAVSEELESRERALLRVVRS